MSTICVSQKSNLSPAKQAVLEKYLKAKIKDRHSGEEIPRKNAATAPLSFAQQRLWLLCQLEPVSAAYNFPTALKIFGKIDLSAMEKAINEIICRHAILRTRFVTVAEQPQQVIVPEIKIAMVIEDINEFTDSEVDKIIKAEGLKPFVLSEYPLFRTRLLYLGQSCGEETYVFLVNMHHIISDGWSAGILFREFATLYIDYCNEMPTSLPELPIQYADFSYWQHNGLQEGRLNRQLAYWKKQLAGSPNLLNLPTDHPRLPIRGFLGATHFFAITPELTDGLNRLSRLQGVTLFTVLLAAFNSLLFRYSGEKDICVGIPVAGRTKPELEDLIGFFVNTLVIRTKLDELLDDCNASLLLTQDRLLTGFGTGIAKTLCLDREWPTDEEQIDGELPVLVDPSNAAYLIYTSGSTGKSKGVIISHKNAVASTFARFSYYPESPDGFLLLSPFAFDSSIAGIFWTLGSGGRLYIPSESDHQDPQALVNSVAQEALSHLLCTPSFYSLLLDYGNQGQLIGLRTAIVAGETCSPDLAAKHARYLPTTRLYNEYGPTEATVWSSVYEIQAADSTDDVRVPIGRPVANSQIYILDACLNQVPAGMPGEIYVGGAGIARGYHNRFDMTAERFLPNPFSSEAGTRVYRSGDKARFLPDGRIEFLGRVDHQVKIRGFRIELGEIEARLVQHNTVSDAVVLVQEDRGDKRLVAYVAGLQSGIENAALSENLREYLRAALPVYMVPTRIVALAALPLNDNGKIDRNALSILDISGNLEKPFVEPGNPLEEELVKIWMEVLGVERIGVTDDFFELGGHSILAMQLLFKIRNSFNCDLSLRDLFQMPTVAAQARLLAAHDVNGHSNADSIDWESETALDESIYPLSRYRPGAVVKSVFLTGASGFLGVFLLKELLEQSRGTVYCLVRAATSSQGFEKIRQNLDTYGLWDSDYGSRIYPVCGDLAKPRLGIQTSQWQQLAGEIDAIYHNGASVNFVYPYATLKAANVSGTEEVLRLACTTKVKAVHYISTLSVFENDSNVDGTRVTEDDFPEDGIRLVGGYAQSKWVAEKMVRMAGSRGLPVSIYRPSTITGDSRSGAWNTSDYLSKVIGACLLLGKAPAQESLFNTVPVDYVSRALVFLSGQSQAIGKTYHLTNSSLLSSNQLVDWACAADLPLERVDFNDWLAGLRDIVGNSSDHPFFSLVPMLDQGAMNVTKNEDSYIRTPAYDCKNVIAGLSRTGIICPTPDERLWSMYFHYLQKAYDGHPSVAV